MKNRYFLILWLISFSIFSHAQDLDFVFDHYGVEDGLSQSEVNCIFQDSRGLIWIGTQAGLNRFDGRNFISYDKNPLDSNSISSGWIYAIDEDEDGNLWVGTQNGLNKFDPKTGYFKHFLTTEHDIEEVDRNNVYSVLIDKKDLIWIKTDYTISKFIPSQERFIHYSHKSEEDFFIKAKEDFSLPMIKTTEGIWAGSSFGLKFFSFEHDQVHNYQSKNDKDNILQSYITALVMDNSGNLYVGTENGILYLEVFRGIVRTRETAELTKALEESGSLNVTGLITFTNSERRFLLISTYGGGLVVYNLTNKTYKIVQEDVTNNQSLTYNRVKTLFQDQSGNYWIGLNGKGLDKFSPKGIKFKSYKNSGNSGVKLTDNMIASLFANEEEIWIGTWSSGLNILKRKSNEVIVIDTKGPQGRNIVDDHVHAITKMPNDDIWIGTRNGISIYSHSTRNFYTFEDYFGIKLPDNLMKTRINIIKPYKDNLILIGSEKGLVYFSISDKSFSYPMSTSSQNNIKSTVYDILIDYEYIWVATAEGLYKLDHNKNIVKSFITGDDLGKKSDGTYSKPNSSGIYDIAKDKFSYLWLATESGLNKFNPKSETFQYYRKENKGIPDNTIYELLLYQSQKLWFSTNRGIGMLNVQTDSIKTYTEYDGLQGLEFNNGASYASETGEFLFGGLDGFNVFFPDSIKENNVKPITTLLSYTVINHKGLSQTKSLFGVDEIHMSYSDNSIKIYFAALEFTNPLKNNYKYKLEGLDDSWVDLETLNSVFFPSLRPGEYTLKVKGSNNDLIWGNETSLKIVVSYPFYDNIYAYFVYFLIVALIILKIWRSNRNKQLKANEEIRNKQLMNLRLEQQKEELDIQHTNMRDSINYAKHIQEAMLPSEYLFKKLLPESFVLYMTKDIVSGDFYWIAQKGTKIFVAAVDCTGHGVPGAFMSIIGFDLLKNIVRERGVDDPAEILNQLNFGVSDTFRKSNTDAQKVRDGMDMALCVIDQSKRTIEFAGAMNPICMIRNESISLIRGNRFSIGSFGDDENNKFEKYVINYEPGDTIYMFSDGYADQFGGPLGKKFKQKRFLHMLLNIHHLSMNKQKAELKENFIRWRDQIEQVDDVLVIGFKL
ncbi:MAG: SpoIIE family protein phosphatase [Bacteroidales bacterium]|nr:SpoIIE family protein phosphatase [Bacteroidales bacterium]